MKKIITIIIGVIISVTSYGQLLAPKGIKVGTGGTAKTLSVAELGTLDGIPTASSIATQIGLKVAIADTATMLTKYARKKSPTFTGIPIAPTASGGTNTTQIATTAFVLANQGSSTGKLNTSDTSSMLTKYARKLNYRRLNNHDSLSTLDEKAYSSLSGKPTLGTAAAQDVGYFATASQGTDARTPTSHAHGNITNVGAIGSTATLPVITTTSGVLTTSSFGTTSGTFTQGNDSRLSDARTPSAHNQAVSTISDATTIGQNLVKLTNPSAITFPRINVNNTVDALSASDFRTAIGAGSGGGDVTLTGVETLTNKTLTSPKINENVALTATSTYLNRVDATSSIQGQLNAKADAVGLTSANDYIIEKISSTYYARPAAGSSYTAYSGADATTVIQAATDALTSGGTIFFKTGTFTINTGISITNDNITFDGAGQSQSILKLKASFDVGFTYDSDPCALIWLLSSENFKIKGIELDGNAANQTQAWELTNTTACSMGIMGRYGYDRTDGVLIENCYIHDFTQYGIWLCIGDRCVIRNSRIDNNDENNINFSSGMTNSLVEHCFIEGSGSVSVAMAGNNNTVTDCFIHHSGTSPGASYGGEIMAPSRLGGKCIKYIDNTIIGFKQGIFSNGPYSRNCVIQGNLIDSISSRGIAFDGDSGSFITTNRILHFGTYGILLEGSRRMQVSNNMVSSASATWGLVMYADSPNNSQYNFITGNSFLNHSSGGIHLDATSSYNIFINNYIDGTGNDDLDDSGTGNIYKLNYGVKTAGFIGGS